jgi:hypothetical protein
MKPTLFLFVGIFCFICGCMSEQERKEWNRKQEQEHTVYLFSIGGVAYPGTRESYIASHPFCTKEDVRVFFMYNAEKAVIGWLDKKDGDGGSFDRAWNSLTSGEKEEMLNIFGKLFNEIILNQAFVRGITLEQLRVSLQVPLKAEYIGLHSSMYSWGCESPNYSTDCTIHFTFIDGRLSDWTKTYLPHIYETTYTPPIYYDKKHR